MRGGNDASLILAHHSFNPCERWCRTFDRRGLECPDNVMKLVNIKLLWDAAGPLRAGAGHLEGSLGDYLRHFEVWRLADAKY